MKINYSLFTIALCVGSTLLSADNVKDPKATTVLRLALDKSPEGGIRLQISPSSLPIPPVDERAWPKRADLCAAVDSGWEKGLAVLPAVRAELSAETPEAAYDITKQRLMLAVNYNPQCIIRATHLGPKARRSEVLKCAENVGKHAAILAGTFPRDPDFKFAHSTYNFVAKYTVVSQSWLLKPRSDA